MLFHRVVTSYGLAEDSIFLQNTGIHLQVHMASQSTKQHQHLHCHVNLKSHYMKFIYVVVFCSIWLHAMVLEKHSAPCSGLKAWRKNPGNKHLYSYHGEKLKSCMKYIVFNLLYLSVIYGQLLQ
jgi:hypothetical protein